MFDLLTSKITKVLDKLKNSGVLTESNISEALREIRIALLSADVSLAVAKKFIDDVKNEALGKEVLKSLSPSQMIIKIVRNNLIKVLGGTKTKIDFSKTQTKIMLVGLQGAGKTTTAAKIVQLFKKRYENKSSVLCSIDVYRPAAIEQLKLLAKKVETDFFDIDLNKKIEDNVKDFMSYGALNSTDLLVLDTAGRLQIDEEKMDELIKLKKVFQPDEILLVADITTGQEAINIAKTYNDLLDLTGIILTRIDGDAKGGVALSMKDVTGVQIRYLCTGEAIDKIEEFHAERIADRILDMGDVISLIEKAQVNFEQNELENSAQKMLTGKFDLNDFADNLRKLNKLGGITGVAKFLPQFNKISDLMQNHGISDNITDRYMAIINSMTKLERKNANILDASRKKRIAAGSGTSIQDINKLLKQFAAMRDMFKMVKNMSGKKGFMDKFAAKFNQIKR